MTFLFWILLAAGCLAMIFLGYVINEGPLTLKRWFNQRYPYRRLCLAHWCLRGQVYDHRCHRHQIDEP